MTLSGRQIVCVGFADWQTELWTNQQHLMSRLAADNDVLFVESLGLRRPALAGRDIKRIARRLWRGVRPLWRGPALRDGVHVLSPLVLPLHSSRVVRALNASLLRAVVRLNARRLRFEHPILWAYVPQAQSLVAALHPSLVIYHCVDDIAAQERVHSASFAAAEDSFAARADLVLASAPKLAERMRKLSDNVMYAPNVADTALFETALQEGPVDPAIAALPAPVLVFTGAIAAAKLDLELIAELADSHPEWSIALVGPVGLGDPGTDVARLAAHANVHLLGARRYEQLPAVLRGADAGLIPYRRSQLTDSIFPMKVNEYLAAGLPVVATELPALEGEQLVERAADAREFGAKLEAALAADSDELRGRRARMARERSWENRRAEIEAAIDSLSRGG